MSLSPPTATVGHWSVFEPLRLDPILEASLAAFTDLGYHGASVRDIANRVGVTVPTLYYHYKSKQGLLLALLQSSINDLLARTREALDEAEGDPLPRFVDLVDCTVRFLCHRRQVAKLDAEGRYLDQDARAVYAAPRKEVERQFLGVIEDGVASGMFGVGHAVDVNRALLGTYQSIATWYREDGALSPTEVAARHVEFSLDALRTATTDRDAGISRVRERAER